PTPAEQIGRVREAVTEQGRRARFHVVGEEYDAAARTRTTRVHYRLDGPEGVQEADRDWVMHWYTDDGFRQLAEDAGLTVERVDVPADDERVVLLRRAAS
ncbi:MAG: class I SAM-dependent methyltransferase, partial [Cellulomonas iranensis]|nr:class I SAM-dependent methyltransferase [Cellulomonas iranensis]